MATAIINMWHELLTRPWWVYNPEAGNPWGLVYRWFNLGEATVWFAFAVLVANRWRRWRNTPLELLYALAFAAFGLTDLREACVISAALVAAKAVNLAALLLIRAYIVRHYYPGSRLY